MQQSIGEQISELGERSRRHLSESSSTWHVTQGMSQRHRAPPWPGNDVLRAWGPRQARTAMLCQPQDRIESTQPPSSSPPARRTPFERVPIAKHFFKHLRSSTSEWHGIQLQCGGRQCHGTKGPEAPPPAPHLACSHQRSATPPNLHPSPFQVDCNKHWRRKCGAESLRAGGNSREKHGLGCWCRRKRRQGRVARGGSGERNNGSEGGKNEERAGPLVSGKERRER